MITAKRVLVVATFLFFCLVIIRTTHPAGKGLDDRVLNVHSPRPVGSYQDNKKLQSAQIHTSNKPLEPAATPHFDGKVRQNHPRPQIPLQDLRAIPLREQLAYIFPYNELGRFPAYIWQTWKNSPAEKNFDEGYRSKVKSWTDKHPDFVHEVITDQTAVYLISHLYSAVPEVVEAYNALPVPVLKADFFRYLILLARGGIYSDIDTDALKPATEWVPADVDRSTFGLVIGIEADPDRPDWAEWYSRRIQFCQWTIQAKMGHPVLRNVVASITEETLARKRAGTLVASKLDNVIEFTGPARWTDTIFAFMNDPAYFDLSSSTENVTYKQFTGMTEARRIGDVIVLPITSFSPGVGHMNAQGIDDPMAFVHHNFLGMLHSAVFTPHTNTCQGHGSTMSKRSSQRRHDTAGLNVAVYTPAEVVVQALNGDDAMISLLHVIDCAIDYLIMLFALS